MSQQWAVKAWAGAYSWTVLDNDPAGYGLASPLTIANGLPTSDVAPLVQPNSATASFQVIVAQVADLDQLQLGDPVTLRYWPSRTPAAGDRPSIEFAGRVATMEAQPHKLGVLYTIGCVDYIADIAENTVGGSFAWPQENLDDRVRRILSTCGYAVPAGTGLYGGTGSIPIQALIDARPIGKANALELLLHTLAQYRMNFTGFPNSHGIAYVAQQTVPRAGVSNWSSGAAVLDATAPYIILTTFSSPQFTAPLRVTLVGGVYKLTGSTAQSAAGGVGVVDAGRVSMDTKFAQRKGDATNAIAVTGNAIGTQTAAWSGVAQRVEASVETELSTAADGAALAAEYLPPVKPSQAALWVADTMRWLIDAEPGTWFLPTIGRGFMVVRVNGVWSPLEREWYVGLLSGLKFSVDGGVPVADLDVIPWNVDPAQSLNPVKWSDLPALMTYANMSTRDTFTDYGLAGI